MAANTKNEGLDDVIEQTFSNIGRARAQLIKVFEKGQETLQSLQEPIEYLFVEIEKDVIQARLKIGDLIKDAQESEKTVCTNFTTEVDGFLQELNLIRDQSVTVMSDNLEKLFRLYEQLMRDAKKCIAELNKKGEEQTANISNEVAHLIEVGKIHVDQVNSIIEMKLKKKSIEE